MKYMFIVQGEGRGHLTQAIALAQILRRNGHQVVEVLVGRCKNRELPAFFDEKIDCRVRVFDSPSLDYGRSGKRGRIIKSIIANTTPARLSRWRKSMDMIVRRIEKTEPDVVVNFYEILLGITSVVHRINVPVVSIAHQFLIDHPDYAHRSTTDQGQFVLRLNNMLCSLGTTKTLALSLYPLKDFYRERMAVVPPLLRQEIFELQPYNYDYILGYMLNAGYADELRSWSKAHPGQKLHVFWDKKSAPECLAEGTDLTLHRINDQKFLSFMEGCAGYVTTAGFESVCEAMYLGKPVMMIPAHIEQQINAADAAGVGAGIVSDSFDVSRLVEYIPNYSADTEGFREWVKSAEELFVRHLTTLV